MPHTSVKLVDDAQGGIVAVYVDESHQSANAVFSSVARMLDVVRSGLVGGRKILSQ